MPVLINKESGYAEDLPNQAAASQSLVTGTHDVPLVNQKGEIESFAHNDIGDALSNGYTEPKPEQLQSLLKTAKYSTPSQQAIGAAEQVAKGAFSFLAPAAERAMGIKAEDIQGREENQSTMAKMVGQGVGLVGSTLLPGGQAKLLTKAGEIVNVGREALGLGEATGIIGKIGTSAAKAGVENAVYQSGDELAKKIQDPESTSGSVLANIGLASAIGAGTGGVFGAVSPLWSATVGPKVEEMLGLIKNRANGETLPISQDLSTVLGTLEKNGVKVSPEIIAGLSDNPLANDHFRRLIESGTTTGQAISETLDKFKSDVGDQLKGVFQKGAPMTSFEAGEAAKESIMSKIEELNKNVEDHFNKIAPDRAAVSTSDNARQEAYKQMLKIGKEEFGEDSPQYALFKNYGERVVARDSIAKLDQLRTELFNEIKGARSFANPQFEKARALGTIRDFIGDFQDSQIGVAAKDMHLKQGLPEADAKAAADNLIADTKAARKVYKEFIGNIGDVASAGKLGKVGSYGQLIEAIDKVPSAKFADKLFDPKNIEGLRELQKQHPDAFNAIMQAKKTSMIESATTKGDLMHNQLLNNVNKLPKEVRNMMFDKQEQDIINASGRILRESGKRLNPSGTAKTLDKLWQHAGAGAGAIASMLLGHNPLAGVLIGEAAKFLSRDAPDAAKMALLKYLGSAGTVDAEALKATNDYIRAALKGEALIQKASKAALKAGQEVLPKMYIPDQKSRDKLDKKLKELQADNSSMMNVAGDIGKYMPDHAGSLAGYSMSAVNYLNSIRPQVQRLSPLDSEIEPPKHEKAAYNRALDIAEQPLVTLQSIQDGTLTPTDIKHLTSMYPQVYKKISESLTGAMVNQKSGEEPIKYQQRLGLSLFLAQPLDSTMTPMGILGAQPQPAQASQDQQPKMSRGHPSQVTQKAMSNIAKGNATPGQQREMIKSGSAKA